MTAADDKGRKEKSCGKKKVKKSVVI